MSAKGTELTKKQLVKRNQILLISTAVIVVVAISIFIAGTNLGWFAAAPEQQNPTSFDLKIVNYATDEELKSSDVDVAWYKYKIQSGDDLADLKFSDFEAMTSTAKTLTPEAGYVYVGKINSSGFNDVWVSTSSLIADGQLNQLILGTNTIRMMNVSEGMSVSVVKTSGDMTDPLGKTNASYGEWKVSVYQLDKDKKITNLEGFKSFFDFKEDEKNVFAIKLNFTDGSSLVSGDVKLLGMDILPTIDKTSNCLYFEIPATVIGKNEFTLKFSNNIGNDLELESIAIGIGYAGSIIEKAKQTFNGY